MNENYASSVDTRTTAGYQQKRIAEEMGTWEKVVFGVVFFFTTIG